MVNHSYDDTNPDSDFDEPRPRAAPKLRKFQVLVSVNGDNSIHYIYAHLVFNNAARGEGVVFRRYNDDNVRTEKVAEFAIGSVVYYKEIANGE